MINLIKSIKKFMGSSLLGWLLCNPIWVFAIDDQWQDVDRIVAIGDIHADYPHFVEVLTNAGIINKRGNWIAGATHLVQLGDVPDRGSDTVLCINLLRKLERQALRAGGMVHALIGNHEAMNILGDLSYVHPNDYKVLQSNQARRLQNDYYLQVREQQQRTQPDLVTGPEFRALWEQKYPLGFVEHRIAWSAKGDIGSWVLEHNAVIKINRTLFLHGGISPAVLGRTMSNINQQVRNELQAGVLTGETGLSESEQGPLWYRGLAQNDEASEAPHVEAVLAFYDVDRIVIGHTPGFGTIMPRFGGKVLLVDSGISDYYGAHLASLVLADNLLLNIQQGTTLNIPTGATDPLPYFQAVAVLEPGASALQELVTRMLNPALPIK
jgi:hypothetical protein